MSTLVRTRRAAVLLGVVYAVGYRPWQRSWGTRGSEATESMPGDELVPRPQWEATRAVDIDARPEEVWPWLVQIGAHPRAGWYSYDWMDNGRVASAREIHPELQHVAVGDVLRMTAGGRGRFVVASVDPGRSLVLHHREGNGDVTAAFVLAPHGARGSRLVHRIRFRVGRGRLVWAAAMDAGDFVMTRRMLLGIRDRAERVARRRHYGPEPTDDAPGRLLRFDLSVPVDRPPQAVWDALADVQDLEPIPRSAGVRMEKVPTGQTRVGTRWHERVRLAPGTWMRVDSVVTAASAPDTLEMDFRSRWFDGHLAYVIEPTLTGCRLHQRETLELRGHVPADARWVDARLRSRLLDRLAEVRDVVEAGHR